MHLYQALAQQKPTRTFAAKFKYIDLFAGIGGVRIPRDELGGMCFVQVAEGQDSNLMR